MTSMASSVRFHVLSSGSGLRLRRDGHFITPADSRAVLVGRVWPWPARLSADRRHQATKILISSVISRHLPALQCGRDERSAAAQKRIGQAIEPQKTAHPLRACCASAHSNPLVVKLISSSRSRGSCLGYCEVRNARAALTLPKL